MKKIIAKKQNEGKRLDLLLKFHLPKYSRSSIKKMLNQHKVKVNGELEYRANYKVSAGDEVEIDLDEQLSREPLQPWDPGFIVPTIYEDEHILAVNKPSGLKVHPAGHNDKESLLNIIYHQKQDELADYGVTLVNRIDSGTSGIVLIAKTPKGAWHYSKQFSKGLVDKFYLAVVKGKWVQKYQDRTIELHNFITYDHNLSRQVVDKNDKGDFAHTQASILEYNPSNNLNLLLVKPLTGRTHQIRVQLAFIGFPIVGDQKYGGQAEDLMALHSYRLRIKRLGDNGFLDLKTEVPSKISKFGFDYGQK